MKPAWGSACCRKASSCWPRATARAPRRCWRVHVERDTVLAAHALIEDHDLVGSFTNMTGLNCAIASQDDDHTVFAKPSFQPQPAARLSCRRLALSGADAAAGGGGPSRCSRPPRVLEFASGHGRFTATSSRRWAPIAWWCRTWCRMRWSFRGARLAWTVSCRPAYPSRCR